jgi:hypothetical protein
LTFTGTGFLGTPSIDAGAGTTVSNIVVVSSTTLTADLDVAANAATGDRPVTVTTAGGTSNAVSVRIHGVPVINSISPVSGAPGSVVTVTLLGSNFHSSGVSVSGTGITTSNMQILNSATKITIKFTIASNAPPGPRDVTVSNIAGTSNAVTFTVN